eukprot:3665246-Alexandrium_andersonii.AAC.1
MRGQHETPPVMSGLCAGTSCIRAVATLILHAAQCSGWTCSRSIPWPHRFLHHVEQAGRTGAPLLGRTSA